MTADHLAVRLGRAELARLLVDDNAALGRGGAALQRRQHGLGLLLDWLEHAEGSSWQACWVQRGEPADWQAAAGATSTWQRLGMTAALTSLLCHRILQPSYPWLFRQRLHTLEALLFASTDQGEDARLVAAGRRAGMSATMLGQALSVLPYVLVHTGRRLDRLTTADVLAYGQARRALGKPALGVAAAQQLLWELGIVDEPAVTKGSVGGSGSAPWRSWSTATRSPAVRSATCSCATWRNALRRWTTPPCRRWPGGWWDCSGATLSATTLASAPCSCPPRSPPGGAVVPCCVPTAGLAAMPPTCSPACGPSTSTLLSGPPRTRRPGGAGWRRARSPQPTCVASPRPSTTSKRRCTPVSAPWPRSCPPWSPPPTSTWSPPGAAGGRERLPARRDLHGRWSPLPARGPPARPPRGLHAPVLVKPTDQPTRRAINCQAHEADAFWTWAIIEVLRLTGIRLEELLELTHLSIRHYRLPDGELVVLLQVAPSKTDRERVIPVCPELAHVLAMVVARARGHQPAVPLVCRYDHYERLTSAPLPYLFQRSPNGAPVVIGHQGARDAITRAATRAGLRDVDGRPLRLVPHDFRRLFATEAVNGGLPIHIAAKLLGHLDLNTTKGYVAVYPEQVIRHFQAHLVRRRAIRPSQEYREPTTQEWAGFEQHFRRRRMALGDCYRPYGSDCPHEHACVRCPMLRMDPAQLPRLLQIEHDTHRLLAEAQQNGWEGEATGLQDTLAHIADKKAQVQRIQANSAGSTTPVWLTLSPAPA